jgi:opacity protein-like surface antigen
MRSLLLILSIAHFAPTALAQSQSEPGALYLGGLLGRSQFSENCSQGCDDSSNALRAFAGVQLNRYFGLEAGVAHLGEATGQEFGVPVTTSARVFDFTLLAHWPIAEKVSLFGRIGAYAGKTTGTFTDSNTGLTLGFGAQFAASRNLSLRVEYQDYATMSYSLHVFDVSLLGLSALWRF